MGNPDPDSMDLLYGGHSHTPWYFLDFAFHYYFEIDIGTTYKMIHNNDPAEVQEYV